MSENITLDHPKIAHVVKRYEEVMAGTLPLTQKQMVCRHFVREFSAIVNFPPYSDEWAESNRELVDMFNKIGRSAGYS